MSKFIDLTGRQFGRLIVLRKSPNRNGYWICKCTCEKGTIKEIFGGSLRSGATKSCGCYRKEKALQSIRERHPATNTYDLSGEYGICHINNDIEFYFDKEDYEILKKYQWRINKKNTILTKNALYASRLIMSKYHDIENLYIHFRNRNKLDLRKENMMLVTKKESGALGRFNMLEDPNDSEGVYQDKYGWKAFIRYLGKSYRLGYFDKKEDAVKARKQAEKKYYGKYFID
jgi:hypothetical protein